MRPRPQRLLPAIAAAAVLGPAVEAGACPDACATVSGVLAATTPTDQVVPQGVLVFELARAEAPSQGLDALLPSMRVDVVDELGDTIDGQVELALGRLVWRPTASLAIDQELVATLLIDNATIATGDPIEAQAETCLVSDIDVVAPFTVIDADLAEPPAFTTAVDVLPIEEPDLTAGLDQIVCCDGAIPSLQPDACLANPVVTWAAGHCEPVRANRRLEATSWFAWDAETPTFAIANYAQVLSYNDQDVAVGGAGDFVLLSVVDEPGCATLSLWDFAAQTSKALETICVDDEQAGGLGAVQYDPSVPLAEQCASAPYTCDTVESSWDDTQCAPWPAPDEGGSSSGEDGGSSSGDPAETDDGSATDDGGSDDDAWEPASGAGCNSEPEPEPEPQSGCASPDEHDHTDDHAQGCAYCGQGTRRPPYLLFLLLVAARPRRRKR